MSELHIESPLAHRSQPQGLSITLREITERGMIDVRGSTSDKKFLAAVKKVLGLDLPKTPRTSKRDEVVPVLCARDSVIVIVLAGGKDGTQSHCCGDEEQCTVFSDCSSHCLVRGL